MMLGIVPQPKEIGSRHGELQLSIGNTGEQACVVMSSEQVRVPAELIAERFKLSARFARARQASGDETDGVLIRLNIVTDLDFLQQVRPDLRAEAYRLEVSQNGIDVSALTVEGLLRAVATLFQMARIENDRVVVPCAVIKDWPNFRYRCGSDWLINVECNRWAYDWGDGRKAFLERIKRKLAFCFAHKINMVWFDGFGWNTKRFPGYAKLMHACNRYARRLGIKLVFAGYGGGYGLAYQKTENTHKCGYFGNVYLNRRPYPDGDEYDCCGFPADISRRHGTCYSNRQLRAAKLEELKRFVSEINPGCMYIHDLDAANWVTSLKVWKERCGECRKRWPSDELPGADGLAGAYASWIRQVRRELSALPACGDYLPARDLVLIFISPLYTMYNEPGAENLWESEMQYFDSLSRGIGPAQGIEFGLREQFYYAGNRKKIGDLRDKLAQNGNGHGLHVIAFGGGDNCLSDDLANLSGAMAHFYDGAESVCLSNGGVHEDLVQMLNAAFLWSGSAGGYRENPADETEAESVFGKIASGAHKPAKIFAAGQYFDRLCLRLWGPKAGKLMSKALQARHNGRIPVCHVWWTITRPLFKLEHDNTRAQMNLAEEFKRWSDRELATASALKYARQAAEVSDNEDIHWFAKCLEVGRQYAKALKLLVLAKSGKNQAAGIRLSRAINDLEAHVRKNFTMKKTDVLGGDPGCWLETIARMKKIAERSAAISK